MRIKDDLTFGFVGIGLIGGSVAKALRRVYPSCKIIVYNRGAKPRVLAINDGTANIALDTVDERFSECDYIFLCTPVERNVEYLTILKDIIKPTCIITDVGSVKTNIHEAVKALSLEDNFIGGHPMAGSEKTSYEHASDRLLENAYYAITPTEKVKQEYVKEYTEIVSDIGAIPVEISYKEHDRVVAAISHLPHLIASSLVNLVKHNDSNKEYMKTLAAGGFKDITRIASSSPEMWEQICMTNVEPIADMLERYIGSLQDILSEIKGHQGDAIYKLFEKSRDYRNTITDRAKGSVEPSYAFSVDVADEVGAISTIAVILAAKGISIKNIGINNNRERGEGALKIEFYDETSMTAAWKRLEYYKYEMVRL